MKTAKVYRLTIKDNPARYRECSVSMVSLLTMERKSGWASILDPTDIYKAGTDLSL